MKNKNNDKITIAIIGAGFTGLSLVANLIRQANLSSIAISIVVFEELPPTQGGAYDIRLPDNFTLNHEADFMGSVNPWRESNTGDFYFWIQEYKNKSLAIFNGLCIKQKYKNFDLDNPKAFLPRSLYGVYLISRLRMLIENAKGKFYSFKYKQQKVVNIKKNDNRFTVQTNQEFEVFDYVILSTGCPYPIQGEENIIYAQNLYTKITTLKIPENKTIGILGSALSSIETALALADKGYKNISLFSRSGRLPKVKGRSNPYQLQLITTDNLRSIKRQDGYFDFPKLLSLLQKEFTYAYRMNNDGLYQPRGINWKKVLKNRSPLAQLEEDIKEAESNKEMTWRSVCLALAKNKPIIFPYIAPEDEKIIFEKFSTFILSFLAPLPLFQAKKLLKCLKTGSIKTYSNISNYTDANSSWKIYLGKTQYFCDYLIDARGPSKNATDSSLIKSLIQNGIASESGVRGLQVNETFQSIVGNKIISNFYILGSVMKAYAPINNSTVYLQTYIKSICESIIEKESEFQTSQKNQMTFSGGISL